MNDTSTVNDAASERLGTAAGDCAPKPPSVRLGDVCRLAGDLQMPLSASERLARKGPYPLYAENCMSSGIDDYAIEEGGTILVGSFGQILANTGYLMAVYEPGRCSATEHVHALIPHDPADGRYLWRVLTTTPKAARLVTGTSQVRQLSGSALLTVSIPWPEREVRDAFVAALDGFDRAAADLAERVPQLLAEGDEAFARIVLADPGEPVAAGELAAWGEGTNVPAVERGQGKPVRIEGPQGRLGFCDEALAAAPAIVVGPCARHLLAHYVGEPSHPIAEMRYVAQDGAGVPLAVLFFALRAAGVYDRLRLDGRQLEAPRLGIDDLAGLMLTVGTPAAQAAFAQQVGDGLLARIAQAGRDADKLSAERRESVGAFIATSALPGVAGAGAVPARGEVPAPRGESLTAERARKLAQERADQLAAQAAGRPGLGLDAARRAELGPLATVVETGAFGLAMPDAAWELAPLACVRACATPDDWRAVARAAGDDAPAGHPGLVGALDAAMGSLAETDDLLSFLPNLSYASSLLAPDQLAAWVRALDAVEPAAIASAHVRAAFALEPGAARLPAAVRLLVERAIAAAAPCLPRGFECAYVPCEACEGVVDALGAVLPNVTVRAQFDEFSHMLEAAMVRAVELRDARATRGGLGAAAGSALLADEFADWTAPLVVAALPPNAGEWTSAPVASADARWVLGTPPRSRANYAWIQQAISHQEPGGLTVLLACNSVLHSTMGSERGLRGELARSGRVRLVATLPARIFDDGRPAMSLLVLGDPRPDPQAACLMVDALDAAVPNPAAEARADVAERMLPAAAADRVARACAAFLAGEKPADEAGFSRTVTVADLAAHDDLLTPWTYTR